MEMDSNYFTKEIDAWQEARLGKFTASGIHALLGKGRAKSDVFSQTAITYINSKIAEILTGEKPEINAKQLEWGIDHEHEAVEEYSKIVNHHVEYFGIAMPKYFAKDEISGGSPDGLLNDDGVLELKCPFNSTYHVKMLRCKDVEEFKKLHLDYYTQDQFNMYVLDRKWCDHVSYDPRMISPNHRLKVLRIDRDEEHINLVCERLGLAVEHMQEALEDLYAIQTNKGDPNLVVESHSETNQPTLL